MALQDSVQKYIREVRQNPAAAVGTQLDQLERATEADFEGSYATRTSPLAALTWMSRATLQPDQVETILDNIALGEPVDIVGCHVTILNVSEDPALVLPPIDAIDVVLQINRREFLTSQAEDKAQVGRSREVVNLSSIDATIANRLMGLKVDGADPDLSVRFRWATTSDIITAKTWSAVQVSINWFVRPRFQNRHLFEVD